IPNGAPQYDAQKYHGFGFSLGANYRLFGGPGSSHGETAVYATFAKSFRLPGFEDYIFGGPATNASTGQVAQGNLVEKILQYEAGQGATRLDFGGPDGQRQRRVLLCGAHAQQLPGGARPLPHQAEQQGA
ncbi:hypothetical protein E4T56_gene15703, partial [Termitomyces sp. T112]